MGYIFLVFLIISLVCNLGQYVENNALLLWVADKGLIAPDDEILKKYIDKVIKKFNT